MAEANPIRTVLLGYGLGGRAFHAPFLAALPQFSLDAVVTSSPERAAQVQADHGTPVLASDADAWERASEFDLAVISTGNAVHVAQAAAALEAGLHVVVDKPLCGDLASGQMLADLARSHGKLLVTYQNRRWDGDFRTVQRLVREDALGRVHRVESRFERWRPEAKGGWRESVDPADLGGLTYDLGSHLLDQALVLLGPVERVYAEQRSLRIPGGPDDESFVALTHTSGAVSHHWFSVLSASNGPRLRVQGSGGEYVIVGLDPQEDALKANPLGVPVPGTDTSWGVRGEDGVLVTGDDTERILTEPGDYRLFWTGLADAIREGAPSPVPIEQTLALLAVIDAARESARTGQVVVPAL